MDGIKMGFLYKILGSEVSERVLTFSALSFGPGHLFYLMSHTSFFESLYCWVAELNIFGERTPPQKLFLLWGIIACLTENKLFYSRLPEQNSYEDGEKKKRFSLKIFIGKKPMWMTKIINCLIYKRRRT